MWIRRSFKFNLLINLFEDLALLKTIGKTMNINLEDVTLDEMDALWEEAKKYD